MLAKSISFSTKKVESKSIIFYKIYMSPVSLVLLKKTVSIGLKNKLTPFHNIRCPLTTPTTKVYLQHSMNIGKK